VVRAALKADRDRLIRLVIDYTKKERANVDVGEPEMVKAWLAICRLASRLRLPAPTPPPATGEAGTRGEVEKASGFVLAAAVAWLYAQALPPGDTARACSDAGLAGAVAAYLRALPEAREGKPKTHG
jgi:hypothetical protein